jgi:hypothetical protein
MNKFIRIYFDIKKPEPDLFVKRSNKKTFELAVQTAGNWRLSNSTAFSMASYVSMSTPYTHSLRSFRYSR